MTQQPPRRSGSGWVLGRIGGAPVVLSPSWFIIAAILVLLFAPTVQQFDPTAPLALVYGVAAIFAVLLFVSVFLHEVAHGLVGRRFGVEIREYQINLWGGHTQFGSEVRTPGASAIVSIVGPLTNAVIGGLGYLVLVYAQPTGMLGAVVLSLEWSNLIVAVFNAVPGLPLDGGRVLEAIVWKVSGSRTTGTLWAGWAGRIVAIGVVLGALVVPYANGFAPNLFTVSWAALIGFYLWFGANQAIRYAQLQRRVEPLSVLTLARTAVTVPAGGTLAEAGEALQRARAQAVVILGSQGQPAAYIDNDVARRIPVDRLAQTPTSAAAVLIPPGATIDAELAGMSMVEAVRRLASTSAMLAVVAGRGAPGAGAGRVVGLLSVTAVAQAMSAPPRS